MFTYLLVVVTRKSRKQITILWCAVYLYFWMFTGASEMDRLYENVTHIHCSWNDAALLWLYLYHVCVLCASHCMQHILLVQTDKQQKCCRGQWEIYIYVPFYPALTLCMHSDTGSLQMLTFCSLFSFVFERICTWCKMCPLLLYFWFEIWSVHGKSIFL